MENRKNCENISVFFFLFPIKIFLKSQTVLPRPNNPTIAQTQNHTQFSAQAKYNHHFYADEFENYLKYHVPKTLSPHEFYGTINILFSKRVM